MSNGAIGNLYCRKCAQSKPRLLDGVCDSCRMTPKEPSDHRERVSSEMRERAERLRNNIVLISSTPDQHGVLLEMLEAELEKVKAEAREEYAKEFSVSWPQFDEAKATARREAIEECEGSHVDIETCRLATEKGFSKGYREGLEEAAMRFDRLGKTTMEGWTGFQVADQIRSLLAKEDR